jgi:hypothetical protein
MRSSRLAAILLAQLPPGPLLVQLLVGAQGVGWGHCGNWTQRPNVKMWFALNPDESFPIHRK